MSSPVSFPAEPVRIVPTGDGHEGGAGSRSVHSVSTTSKWAVSVSSHEEIQGNSKEGHNHDQTDTLTHRHQRIKWNLLLPIVFHVYHGST